VLSSDDPVRVFQQFATLDLISQGRAELMVGRGSFIESYPLFGYDLSDYNALASEKLDLLLKIRDSEHVTWSGQHRAPLSGQGVYPRPLQQPLPIYVGVGGSPESVIRAAKLGLPLAIAISAARRASFAHLPTCIAKHGPKRAARPISARSRFTTSAGLLTRLSKHGTPFGLPIGKSLAG